MDIKIFLLSCKSTFSDFLDECLKEDAFETNYSNRFRKETLEDNIVIINLMKLRENIENEIDYVLDSKCSKIILLQNAMTLYLNSNNETPYSVYSELLPKNELCERLLAIEKKILNSNKSSVIFRITDIYGPSIFDSIVNLVIESNNVVLENSKHDFVYEGDVMQAIEIALRKNVTGLFDIASGNTTSLRELRDLIFKNHKFKKQINWKRKKQEISFNCENFKFYGWQSLIDLETGLKTIFSVKNNKSKI